MRSYRKLRGSLIGGGIYIYICVQYVGAIIFWGTTFMYHLGGAQVEFCFWVEDCKNIRGLPCTAGGFDF